MISIIRWPHYPESFIKTLKLGKLISLSEEDSFSFASFASSVSSSDTAGVGVLTSF